MKEYLLLSIKTKHANQIFNGTKKYEYRKKTIGENNLNKKCFIYSSGDEKKIIGYVIFDKIIKGDIDEIIKITKPNNKNIISNYFDDKEICYALHIKDYKLFSNYIDIKNIKSCTIPQYYRYIREDEELYNILRSELLFNYLLSDDISIYEKEIFEIIPELKNEKNFKQKNSWHCYDVWNHTVKVVNSCDKNKYDRLALLLHDIGKPFSYQDDEEIRHFKNHAKVSSKMAKYILNKLKIEDNKKNLILKLIEFHSTRIELDNINDNNIDFFINLIKIQKCDATGYEINHSIELIEELNKVENILLNYYNLSNTIKKKK